MWRSSGAWRDVRAALPAWVAARLVVASSFAVAHVLFDHVDPPAPAVARHLHQGLLGWDAEWYERIAAEGYSRLPHVGLRFFPLLPLIVRPVRFLVGGHTGVALLLVVNAAALAFGALAHRLCLRETGDERVARLATWTVALAPPAFVLVWGYSEALVGALAVACFLALRRGRWWAAAAAGALAGLARPSGVLLAVPAAVEAARGLRGAPGRERLARAGAVLGPVAGLAAYLVWVGARVGDPFLPLTLQQTSSFRGAAANPVSVLWEAGGDLLAGLWRGNALHVPGALVLVALVALTFRRWPLAYGAYAAVTVVMALSTERWGSLERYGFGAFPVVLTMATVAGSERATRAVLVATTAAMSGYGTLALLGGYVP